MHIKDTKSTVMLGEYPILSIDEARIRAEEKSTSQTFENLLQKVIKYEQNTLRYSKEKIDDRWYVLSVNWLVLSKILKLNAVSKDLDITLIDLLKEIENTRDKTPCIKTYKKLSELLKIAFDAKIMSTQVNIRLLAKHMPKISPREMYIYEKKDLQSFCKLLMTQEN